MEGTAVTLPQHAPYTDPITILICGGSNFGIALDNCVSTQPEVANPTWTIERMVRLNSLPFLPYYSFDLMTAVETSDALYRKFINSS